MSIPITAVDTSLVHLQSSFINHAPHVAVFIGRAGSANFIAVSNNNNKFNAPAIHIVHIVNSSKWLYGTYVYTQSCNVNYWLKYNIR